MHAVPLMERVYRYKIINPVVTHIYIGKKWQVILRGTLVMFDFFISFIFHNIKHTRARYRLSERYAGVFSSRHAHASSPSTKEKPNQYYLFQSHLCTKAKHKKTKIVNKNLNNKKSSRLSKHHTQCIRWW